MPLNETKELAQIVDETILPMEHSGGDGWTILHGDTLQVIRAFKPQVFDAIITDPPYASGGWKPAEKNRTTNQKYSSMDKENALPDFDGDQKDQRSWTRWMAEWLSDARKPANQERRFVCSLTGGSILLLPTLCSGLDGSGVAVRYGIR